MKRRIELKNTAKRKEIADLLEVTDAALSMYFSFTRNSQKAVRAREMALKAGGRLMQEVEKEDVVKILNRKNEVEKVVTNS